MTTSPSYVWKSRIFATFYYWKEPPNNKKQTSDYLESYLKRETDNSPDCRKMPMIEILGLEIITMN